MYLPEEINSLINLDSISQVHIGESKSQVFSLSGKLGQKYYLKISESVYVNLEIEREVKILYWLSERNISVPKQPSIRSSMSFFSDQID